MWYAFEDETRYCFYPGLDFGPRLFITFPGLHEWNIRTEKRSLFLWQTISCVYSWRKQFREKKVHALSWVWQVLFLQASFLIFCGNAQETFISLQLNKESQASAFVTIFLRQGKKNVGQYLLKTSSNHWRLTTWNSAMKLFSNHPFREFRQKIARDIRLAL